MAALIKISKYDFKGCRNPYFFKKSSLQQKRLQKKLESQDILPKELIDFCKINGLSFCGVTTRKKSDKIEIRLINLNDNAIVFNLTDNGILYKNISNQGSWKKALIWNT